ncbi:DUF6712 family protein [Pedobacter ginsengisoli]|uniref:DUF6712 family protein n=1 Tax=Pedobacter ginsengisoli TaxID=363852 RepID=UPI0025506087|nr:DUF6712 family protein [Pedobacter ginsengisoli]
MSLLDNPAEVKLHNSAVAANIDLQNVQSFIDDAILKHLVPAIGQEQFDVIVAGKGGYADGSKGKRVLLLLQKAAVNFMVGAYADFGAVQINSAGISVIKSSNSAPASDKKLMILKRKSLFDAFNALEAAVNFLESNINDFTEYKNSVNHIANRSLLINTAYDFQFAGVNIGSSSRFYQALRIYQRKVESDHIEPLIGSVLMDMLRGFVLTSTGNAKQKALITKLQPAVAFFTMAKALVYLPVSVDESGAYELSETVGGISGNVENRNPAQEKQLMTARSGYLCDGKTELATITKWLVANKADFPDYAVPEDFDMNDGSAPNVYAFL